MSSSGRVVRQPGYLLLKTLLYRASTCQIAVQELSRCTRASFNPRSENLTILHPRRIKAGFALRLEELNRGETSCHSDSMSLDSRLLS